MSNLGKPIRIALAGMGMVMSCGAYADVISNIQFAGTQYTVWDGSTVLGPVAKSLAASVLGGNAAAPGGNVELGKFGGALTVLSGTASGHSVSLSSLQLADWTTALATNYIQGAATAAFGSPLGSSDLATALSAFMTPLSTLGGLAPWQLVSDPNISYVDMTGNQLTIGLAGLLDASPFLSAISGVPLAAGKQASEVVKVSVDGGDPMFLYGFKATPSGVSGPGGSFTGNYQVQIPEPASLALVCIGLLGLGALRRRT